MAVSAFSGGCERATSSDGPTAAIRPSSTATAASSMRSRPSSVTAATSAAS